MKKLKILDRNDLVIQAISAFICAEAGRRRDLRALVDISGAAAMVGASAKERRAAYKRAKKTLKLFC